METWEKVRENANFDLDRVKKWLYQKTLDTLQIKNMPVSFLNVYEYNICLKVSWFRRNCDESMVIGFYKYRPEGNLMLFISTI